MEMALILLLIFADEMEVKKGNGMITKDLFEWKDKIDSDKGNRSYAGDTEKIGVIGNQIVCRISSKLVDGHLGLRQTEYSADEIYYENSEGASSSHIVTMRTHISAVQDFCEKYLFGALNDRIRCKSCGKLMSINNSSNTQEMKNKQLCFITQEMKNKQLCFICLEWTARKKAVSDPLVAIINGALYTINLNENCPNSCKGFAGRRWEIKWKDGRANTVTNNLWYGGKCPEHMIGDFPDTAEFVRRKSITTKR